MLLIAASASAATLTVNTIADETTPTDGLCSLREAIATADAPGTATDCGTADASGNTILLDAKRYPLSIGGMSGSVNSSGDLNVVAAAGTLTIQGAGENVTSIDASLLNDRVLEIDAGATVTLRDLTLKGGHAPDGTTGSVGSNGGNTTSGGPGGSGGPGSNGGAVSNAGSLTVVNTIVSNNAAGNGGVGGAGGATVCCGGGTGGTGGHGGAGGGIYSTGALTLTGVTLSDNHAGAGGVGGAGGDSGDGGGGGGTGGCCGDGGGLANNGGAVTISASTVVGNSAGNGGNGGRGGNGFFTAGAAANGFGGSWGGGISSVNGSISVSNSTIASNATGAGGDGGNGGSITGSSGTGGKAGSGGDSGDGGGVRFTATAGSLSSATVARNGVGQAGTAGTPGSGPTPGSSGSNGTTGMPGGVFVQTPPIATLTDSIVASNTGGNCVSDIDPLHDGGHNLSFGDATCPGSNGDPRLGPLQDNGGPTQTMGLGAGSAAIDQVPVTGAGCPSSDQRGVLRPSGSACDIGAYEVAPPDASTGPATSVTADGATLNATVTPNGASASVDFEYGTTASYGSQTATQHVAGVAPGAVSASLTGLSPNTTYHYRVVAVSADGTQADGDQTFTTTATGTGTGTGAGAGTGAGTGPGPGPGPGPGNSSSPPKLGGLSIKPGAFAVKRGRHRHRRTGATINYTDSLSSTTTFTIWRCVKLVKHSQRCKRYVKTGSFTHRDTAGRNSLHFSGRLRRRALPRGRYRLDATPRINGQTGRTLSVRFRIVG